MRRSALLGDDRGNVLIVTLLILFGVSVIGYAVASMSSMDLKISANRHAHVHALYVAEAGLNEAIYRIALPNPTSMSVGDWKGNVAIADAKPYDPEWEVRVYLTDPSSAPMAGGAVVTTGTFQSPDHPYLAYSAAQDTEDVLTVRHKWKDRDGDGIRDKDEIVLWDPNRIPQENFTSGVPVEVITVTGSKGKARRKVRAEVVAAVGGVTRSGGTVLSPAAVYGNGAVSTHDHRICGYNHYVDTPIGVANGSCADFHVGAGGVSAVAGTGAAQLELYPGGAMTGFPVPTDNTPKTWREPWEVLDLSKDELDDMLADADHTFVRSTMRGVSYFRGDCVIEQPVVGSGLLYVEGDLDIREDFDWTGMIYAGGKLSMDGGRCWVVGAMMARGDIRWESAGTGGDQGVFFSSEAVRRVVDSRRQHTGQRGSVTILSWREL